MSIVAESVIALNDSAAATEPVLNAHCWALQQCLCSAPPENLELRISPLHTRVGWTRGRGKLEAVIQLLVTDVQVGDQWVQAEYSNADHKGIVARCQLGAWIYQQNKIAMNGIRNGSLLRQPPSRLLPQRWKVFFSLPAYNSLAYYCAVLQRFAMKTPPMPRIAVVLPHNITFVAGKHLEMEVTITYLDLAINGGSNWAEANLLLPQHREAAQRIQWREWFALLQSRAHEFIQSVTATRLQKAKRRQAATTTSAPPIDATVT